MKNISMTVILLACMAIASNTYAVGQNEAAETATQILHAYQAQNWAQLAELCTEENRELFQGLAAKSEREESMTSGWRWQAVNNWNGEISEVRYETGRGNDGLASYQASAKFGESGGECLVVAMKFRENKWWFEDIHSPDCSDFNSCSKTCEIVDSAVTVGPGSTSKQELYEQYQEAYDNLTALMEAGKKDTPEGQAAYAEYRRCKALCPSPPN